MPTSSARRSRLALVPGLALVLVFAASPVAFANVAVMQIGTGLYANTTSQHATQVEPDTFAFGSTIVAVFAVPDASGSPRKPFTLAIAGLDFLLASGTTDDRVAGNRIRRCRDGLLAYVAEVERRSRDARELPSGHGVADSTKLCQYTWVLGAAALFFAEARARGLFRAEADRAFASITALLAEAEDENGGFGHGRIAPPGTEPAPGAKRPFAPLPPLPRLGAGYPSTLVSSTNVVALGLGLARPFSPSRPRPGAIRCSSGSGRTT